MQDTDAAVMFVGQLFSVAGLALIMYGLYRLALIVALGMVRKEIEATEEEEASAAPGAAPSIRENPLVVEQAPSFAERAAADVAARQLARRVLGPAAFRLIEENDLVIPSSFNSSLCYRFLHGRLQLESGATELGVFCLLPTMKEPYWDKVLSLYMMVRFAEMIFLRTAYYMPYRHMEYNGMDRKRFAVLFGKENLPAWDSYSSSIPAPVTTR